MKTETENRLKNSYTLYRVTFKTLKGIYEIKILKHRTKDKIYYFKSRNGNICELIKLKPNFYKCNYFDTLVKGSNSTRKIFMRVYYGDGAYYLQIRENNQDGEVLRDIDILKLIEEKENKNER